MSTIPYKQLKDKNGEAFYPMCGESSFSNPIPIEKGGTGANDVTNARINLGLNKMTTTSISTGMESNSTVTLDFDDYDFLVFACTNNLARFYGTTILPTALIKEGSINSVYVYGGSTSYLAQFTISMLNNSITATITGSGIYGAIYGMSL